LDAALWKTFQTRLKERHKLAASLLSGAGYEGTDYWTTRMWNSQESLIVRVLGMGPETPVPSAPGEQESFPTLQRQITLLILTGEQRGVTANVKVARLDGSGLDPIEGRCYLLVHDVFEGGEVQYSIADAYRRHLQQENKNTDGTDGDEISPHTGTGQTNGQETGTGQQATQQAGGQTAAGQQETPPGGQHTDQQTGGQEPGPPPPPDDRQETGQESPSGGPRGSDLPTADSGSKG